MAPFHGDLSSSSSDGDMGFPFEEDDFGSPPDDMGGFYFERDPEEEWDESHLSYSQPMPKSSGKKILYIQMDYCTESTLQTLIQDHALKDSEQINKCSVCSLPGSSGKLCWAYSTSTRSA